MEGILMKSEPIWYKVISEDGKAHYVRKLKHSILTEIADFPDALQYDGAKLHIYRDKPDGVGSISPDMAKRLLDPLKAVVAVIESDLGIVKEPE